MTICYFGIYEPDYSRNRVLISGLRSNGLEIIECRSQLKGLAKYRELIKKHRALKNKYDLLLVGFPGYQAAILARFLTRRPIIFDAFFSIYDSLVRDRKTVKPRTLAALYYWLLDWLSCRLADKVLLDTDAHIKYFRKLFGFKQKKFMKVLLGADDKIFKPGAKRDHDYFLVHFHGIATPLQGVAYILRAAELLRGENVKFNLIGGKIKNRAAGDCDNINFIGTAPYLELAELIKEADVCLGIFGDSAKTRAVIPNKVYEALAAGKAVITADTPAVKELLTDRKNCLLCRTADAADLAEKIMELKNNRELRRTIAENGYRLFLNKLSPSKATRQLAEYIKTNALL